jgi:transposase
MTNKKVGMVSSVRTVDREALAERRKQAIGWHRKGKTQYWIAKRLDVSFEAVRKWVDAYQEKGIKGLQSKGKPGPKPGLTEADKKKIKKAIVKGPRAEGYATDLWTLKRIAKVIRDKTKKNFKTTHTWRIVVSLGFSCQKPERRARERDEKKIEGWRLRSFPPLSVMGPKI